MEAIIRNIRAATEELKISNDNWERKNMTRINLVPPEELTDQHLFAEFREIKMVPKALARSINARGVDGLLIPPRFVLGTGHVSFFYDKGRYLYLRSLLICKELDRRGVNYNRNAMLDPDGVYLRYPELFCDYVPTAEALSIIRERIAQKIAMKPTWYRYRGRPL